MVESHGWTNVRSNANARRTRIRIEVQHLAGGEIFARLRAKRGQVRVEAAARDQQGNAPGEAARNKHHAAADQRAGHSAADPIEQHEHQQRRREPHRLRAQADAESGEECADSRSCGPRPPFRAGDSRRSPSAPGRLPPPRRHQASLRGQRRGQAGQIAHGPDAEIPEQRARRGDRRRRQRFVVNRRRRLHWRGGSAAHAGKHSIQTGDRQQPAEQRQHGERLALRPSMAATADAECRRSRWRSFRGRCRRDNRADAADAWRRRSRGRRARN